MTIEITTEELQEELEGIKTCQPVSISYEGEVKMNKTGNPFHGEIVKSCTINGLIGFVYRNAVNNQLGREDKELDFVPHNRTWGERRGTLVYHKGKVYVEIKAQSNSTPVYKYKDGTEIDKSLLEPFMPKKSAPHTQSSLEKKVILRDINIDNILSVRMLGQEYLVNDTIAIREVVSVEEIMAEIEQD